ncbi:hypothetical protein FHS87_004192 [Roseomonas pecuniae]|uniref:Uncharacterized protein n=1 Tax=Muricoccus pecuniae TaxID=693023 RepID=A0A840YLS8_9PROT|nr:hypothetical protein [Roseomonas pecuniae]
MFAFSIGIAALFALNLFVRGAAHDQGLDRLPTGPFGS